MSFRDRIKSIVNFAHRKEALFSVIFFVTGFVWDSLTLWRPDGVFENVTFWLYLIIVTSCLVALLVIEKRGEERALLLAVTHFCLGNLAGGLIILFGRSGTIQGSLIFFLCGALFLLAHERFKGRYRHHLMRISVWYAILVMYTTLALPILYKRMDDAVFTHALVTSFFCALVFLIALRAVRLIANENDFFISLASVVTITAFFSVAYVLHILPPVPIALRTAGIYHTVIKKGDQYILDYEAPAISFPLDTSTKFNAPLPTRLYCFSSVYAPAQLTTPIKHVWEMYLPNNKTWVSITDVPFSITGGRSEGYRGYSFVSVHQEGWYRCSIMTGNGTLIGRRQVEVHEGVPKIETRNY